MSERYQRLYALPEDLHLKGAPILIAAGALLKDNKDGRILVQLKLQNLSQTPLVACKVSVKAFDPSGAQLLGVENHSYLDLTVSRGETFGAQNPIYLPDNTTRSISAVVTQAVFQNGEVWQSPGGEWDSAARNRKRPQEVFADPELQLQYALEMGEGAPYVPVTVGDLFLCACGAVSLAKDESCPACGRKIADPLLIADQTRLTQKKDARLAQEEADRQEQERKEAEARRIQEQKAEERRIAAAAAKRRGKKIAAVAVAVLVAAAAVTVLMQKVIIPSNQYKEAEDLLAAGDYDGAIAMFAALGEYKDASERILETYYCWGEWYQESEKLQQAKDAFINAGNYSDAPQRAEELHDIAYNMGLEKVQTGDYQVARDLFRFAANKYSDALDYINYCEIKSINFDDGNVHDLAEVMKVFRAIRDKELSKEIEAIPQIQMVIQLEGTWEANEGNWRHKLVFHNGEVENVVVFSGSKLYTQDTYSYTLQYCNREYGYGYMSLTTTYWNKIENITAESFQSVVVSRGVRDSSRVYYKGK